MSLCNRALTFLDFDGTCDQEQDLCARYPHRLIDLRWLRQTNLYCSREAFQTICSSLPRPPGVTLLGSGNYHYAALALIQRLERPFTLVLIDHHADCVDLDAKAPLSCGCWISRAFQTVPRLTNAVMIGPPAQTADILPPALRGRVSIVPDLPRPSIDRILQDIREPDVYLSIDKDVLDRSFVRTNWDQGQLALDWLLPIVEAILRKRCVRGVDICGELPASPMELLEPGIQQSIFRNEDANERILDLLLGAA